MKLIFRIGVVLVSIPLPWIVARWSSRLTLSGPLPGGGNEGTPVTLVVVPVVLVATFLLSVVVGNVAVSRYFKKREKTTSGSGS